MTDYVVAARSNSKGGIKGDKAGDQTGHEVEVHTLASSGTWKKILRPCKNADIMVRQAYNAAANDYIGYAQDNRLSLYNRAKSAGWDVSKIRNACDCDCSSLIAVLANCAGYHVISTMTTYNEVSTLANAGFTVMTYRQLSLRPGDVLWRDSHTAIYVGTSKTYSGAVKKSVSQIAQEVIDGKWGNGDERKKRLQASGYDYGAIQSEVNRMLSGNKTVSQIAQEVIDGRWGNGDERKKRLQAAGYDYNAIQKVVNTIFKR